LSTGGHLGTSKSVTLSRVPVPARRPPQLRGRIFRGSDAIAYGLLSKSDLRSKAWRPLFRDIYADAHLRISHRTRCAVVSRWLIPPEAAIAGRAAAELYGAVGTGPNEPVDVIVPAGRRIGPMAGLRVHSATLDRADLGRLAGMPVTSPERTCWDVAGWFDVVEAVVVIDSLLAKAVVTVEGLREYALQRAGARGWRRLLRAASLADAGAESPQESRVRVRLVLAGLPRPRTQHVVTDNGRFIARLDLAWPEYKVAVEYDGLWHDDPDQFHRDRQRLNRLLGGDWIVLHVTARRLRDDFDGFTAEVRAALRSRAPRRTR
jgi:very-short-patch-repair endonuclease